MVDIAQENLFMYKRLKDKQSSYDLNKLLKDYNKSQYYKQNACRYPSIDFLKDIKNNKSKDSKEHKRKKNIMACKTENNYFPSICRTITSNFKSNKILYKNEKINTCEGFDNSKNKKIKRKKKNFIDFSFKDLKKLKEKKLNSNLDKEINKKDDINKEKDGVQIDKIDINKDKNDNDAQIDNEKKNNCNNNEMEENKNINIENIENIENDEINKNILDENKEKEKEKESKSNNDGDNKNNSKNVSLSNKENLENKEEECISNENNKEKDKDEKI